MINIDPQFQALIPPLDIKEREQLIVNLTTWGCLDPIKVWADFDILLDGHNRFEICNELQIPFDVEEIVLDDRDEAISWILENQLGRRNLSPVNVSYLRGLQYEQAKKKQGEHKGNQYTKMERPQIEVFPKVKTADVLAEKHGVSRATIERDAKFAQSVDVLEAIAPGIKAEILAQDSPLTKAEVVELAENSKTQPEEVKEALETKQKPHVSRTGGYFEWYTPEHIIDAAREAMGGIDLDPSSSAIANEAYIKAPCIYTIDDDGLSQEWHGLVWLNPPYAQPLVANFCDKVVQSYVAGDIEAACVLVNNATETRWFDTLLSEAAAFCLLTSRVKFWQPGYGIAAPLQGQVVVYFGPDAVSFRAAFCDLGRVCKEF